MRQQKAVTGAFGKRRITRGTGRSLQAKAGRRIYRDMADSQWNSESRAITGTELRPRVSIVRKAMMNMNGRNPTKAETAQYVKEYDGIATSGQPHPNVGIRLETGGEKSADPLPKIS